MKNSVTITRLSRKEIVDLPVSYSFHNTRFGTLIVASTPVGVCYVGFGDCGVDVTADMKLRLAGAKFKEEELPLHKAAAEIFETGGKSGKALPLHLCGTDFQIKVWEALVDVPFGELVPYGTIASRIAMPKACRAVGSAVGDNPVSYFVPCHRIVRASGEMGNYFWGTPLKTRIIEWEKANK